MLMDMESSYDFLFNDETQTLPEPWTSISAAKNRAALEAQLHVEVGEGHPLFGTRVTALARCEGCDEVLFGVEGDTARFAQVHLTWRQEPDTPPWPRTKFLPLPISESLADHDH